MEGAIARGAKVVSAEMARAAICCHIGWPQQPSGGAENTLKDRRRRTIISFSLFSFSALEVTNSS